MIMEEYNYRDIDPRRPDMYCSPLTVADEWGECEEFETKVSASMNQSKPVAGSKKIGDCGIGAKEILFVKLRTLFPLDPVESNHIRSFSYPYPSVSSRL